MSLKALSDYTVYAKYARYLPEKKRRESWEEMVDRVFQMHLNRFESAISKNEELKADILFAKQQVKKKRVLGAQRILQFGGEPILKHNAKVFNCSFGYLDRVKAFQETMYLLLCGCGVGFSVQFKHIKKIPNIATPTKGIKVFNPEDSIEGWADCVGVLMSSFFTKDATFPEYKGHEIKFNFSNIRPEGTLIAGQFKAPGHKGLEQALEKVREVIVNRLTAGETKLHAIDVYDIIMHFSNAVLSGGVRRSATICLFSKTDKEMMGAKTGNWFLTHPQRARSNNSVLLVKDDITKEEFSTIIESTKQFGEPGFVFADSEDCGYNPCFEKNTRIHTSKGLIKIKDLYDTCQEFNTLTDNRVIKIDDIDTFKYGISTKPCTKVALTQENANIYKVTTGHGQTLEVTDNHTFITMSGRKQLKDVVIGDKIMLPSGVGSFGDKGSYELGLLLGLVVGDGTIPTYNSKDSARIVVWGEDVDDISDILEMVNNITNHQHTIFYGSQGDVSFASIESKKLMDVFKDFGITKESIKKEVPEVIWQGSRQTVTGYIHGLIYTDGSVPKYKDSSSISSFNIGIDQANYKLLQDIQNLMLNFGIVSRVYKLGHDTDYINNMKECLLPDGKGGNKLYSCSRVSRLVINRPNMVTFETEIGIYGRKGETLKKVLDDRGRDCYKPERFITTIDSVEFSKIADVFCFTEPQTNSTIANGVVIGQCVEIGLYPQTKDGRSGWQFCNLCEINGKFCDTEEKFIQACRAAAIIGTLQAGYTDFKYLSPETKEITDQEALLGCSITGIMDNPDILLNPEIQRRGAKEIRKMNDKIAKLIGINPAARTTCVKPAGSTSCVLGTASGIHPHHAKRYIRRVQANYLEYPLKKFSEVNPIAIEKSVWSSSGTDMVISFLCEVPKGAVVKNNLRAVELLEKVKTTQQNWVEAGTNKELCLLQSLRHNVSNTITVNDDEWDEVRDYIYNNKKWFAGISLLSAAGDLDYPQAPFATVLNAREIVDEYGDAAVFASGLIVDGLNAYKNNLWAACDSVLGVGEKVKDFDFLIIPHEQSDDYKQWLKCDWNRRAKQFADRYFNGNIRKASHCLKHVSLWKTWCDLQREYKEIDWSLVVEEIETYVDATTLGAQACAGGACAI